MYRGALVQARCRRARIRSARTWCHLKPLTAALTALALLPACVGPSRTTEDYQRKVANSAEAAISAVESALLTVEVADDQRDVPPYVSLRLSEDEEAIAAVETAFGAVQPPDPELDALRSETLATIGNAADLLEELRIAAYRAELERLPEIAEELEEPLDHLRHLMEIAPT